MCGFDTVVVSFCYNVGGASMERRLDGFQGFSLMYIAINRLWLRYNVKSLLNPKLVLHHLFKYLIAIIAANGYTMALYKNLVAFNTLYFIYGDNV